MLKTKNSRKLFKEAHKYLVGGVNSPVRAFKSVGGTPIFMNRGVGGQLWDVDGNRFTDFVSSWGPMILGHAEKNSVSQVQKIISKGSSFGTPTELEVRMAKLVCTSIPSIQKIRFVSSGTEAVMSAIRLARAYSNKIKIIKFAGCYHGHSDSMLVKAGSGATTLGTPDSAGIPESVTKHTIILPYNDTQSLKDCFKIYGDNIAAVILEPVAANMGCVLPNIDFLKECRALTTQYASVLIFDEVITGFRLSMGGAQKMLKVIPDITCLGKIIGGGFPVGAFGGKSKIMQLLAPSGPVYQAGTLSGNPVAMTAGISALNTLKNTNPYGLLEKRTKKLVTYLRQHIQEKSIPVHINSIGSMFTLFFNDGRVTDYTSALRSNIKHYSRFFHHLLEEKIYFPPSQFETAFISTAHTDSILDQASSSILKAFSKI